MVSTVVGEVGHKHGHREANAAEHADAGEGRPCGTLWHLDDTKALPDDLYLKALKAQYSERVDATEFLDLLKRVDTWRDYRNEIMHALMNKNLVAIDEHLAEKCEEGMALARELQAQVKRVKYGNRIRRSIKLPVR